MTATSTTFRIRRASAADASLLADLATRTFLDAFAADNDPLDIQRYVAESFSPDRITAELAAPGSTFLLAYHDAFSTTAPVGYARLRLGPNEHVDARRPVELVRIYVEPAATGHGYGAALLRGCLETAAQLGCDAIWLGVWEHNERARRFYERWGFRRIGEQVFVLGSDVQTDDVMSRAVATPGPTTP